MYVLIYGAQEIQGTFDELEKQAEKLNHCWAILSPSGRIMKACRGII